MTRKSTVRSLARLFADELGGTPLRADGAMNAKDLYHCLNDALKRFDQGEVG